MVITITATNLVDFLVNALPRCHKTPDSKNEKTVKRLKCAALSKYGNWKSPGSGRFSDGDKVAQKIKKVHATNNPVYSLKFIPQLALYTGQQLGAPCFLQHH